MTDGEWTESITLRAVIPDFSVARRSARPGTLGWAMSRWTFGVESPQDGDLLALRRFVESLKPRRL